MKQRRLVCLIAVCILMAASAAEASLVFVPGNYGLSARSVALGNAMTAVGDDSASNFYNPSTLGARTNHAIDLGYLYAAPAFNGGVKGADVDLDFTKVNQVGLIGLSLDLSGIFDFDHGLGLGINIAIDENLAGVLNFNEIRDERGQFARYGNSSIFVSFGLGVEIIPELYIGGGAFIGVKGKNGLVAQTDLAGSTKEEQINVEAEPMIAPIVGLYAPFHPMVTLGAVYRGKVVTSFDDINAQTQALVSDSELTTLDLVMVFKDGYVPQQAALGVSVRPIDELMLAVEGSWVNWSDFEDEVDDSVVRDEGGLHTRDIYIPRLGIEWTAYENLYIRFGYYWEDTPFSKPGLGNTAILDNEKHVGSFGVGYDVTQIPFLSQPLTIAATYFHQYLVPRTVESQDGTKYESSGNLNGVAGTITLRF